LREALPVLAEFTHAINEFLLVVQRHDAHLSFQPIGLKRLFDEILVGHHSIREGYGLVVQVVRKLRDLTPRFRA
jgi:hypothetical protein